MPKRVRSKAQRALDAIEIERLHLMGMQGLEIARRLGISDSTVSDQLLAIREAWKHRALEMHETAKQAEVEKLHLLEATYWREWEASQKERTQVTVTEAGGTTVTQTKRTLGAGDLRTLAGVERLIQQRRELLGLDAPKKQALTDAAGNDLVPLEQLRELFFQAMGEDAAAQGA